MATTKKSRRGTPPAAATEPDAQAAYDQEDRNVAAERLAVALGKQEALAAALAEARGRVRRLERELREAGWNVGLAATYIRQLSARGPAAEADGRAGKAPEGMDGRPAGG